MSDQNEKQPVNESSAEQLSEADLDKVAGGAAATAPKPTTEIQPKVIWAKGKSW